MRCPDCGGRKLRRRNIYQKNQRSRNPRRIIGPRGRGHWLRNPLLISAFNKIEPTAEFYPTIFGDYDEDGILDVDDPTPYTYDPDAGTVEEIKLSDEIRALISYRNDMEKAKDKILHKLNQLGGKRAYGRTKTPFSIIHKLRRYFMRALTDVVGTTIIAKNGEHLETLKDKVLSGRLGVVREFRDYYSKPKAGYRAYHFILEEDGLPIEVQLKTERQALLGEASHTPYKQGKKDQGKYLELTELAHLADMGDKPAMAEFKRVTQDIKQLTNLLTKSG